MDTPKVAQDAADDELYREALSSSLKQVSDDDLECMIIFFSHMHPTLNPSDKMPFWHSTPWPYDMKGMLPGLAPQPVGFAGHDGSMPLAVKAPQEINEGTARPALKWLSDRI